MTESIVATNGSVLDQVPAPVDALNEIPVAIAQIDDGPVNAGAGVTLRLWVADEVQPPEVTV